jgi:hypothetical protein
MENLLPYVPYATKTRLKEIMKIKAIGILLLLSQSLSYGAGVASFGDYDCGQWFTRKEVARGWLLGYLSGINHVLADDKKGFDPLNKLNSADQAYLWIENYCKANPLKQLSAAGSLLYLELEKK